MVPVSPPPVGGAPQAVVPPPTAVPRAVVPPGPVAAPQGGQGAQGCGRVVVYVDYKVGSWTDLTGDIKAAVDAGYSAINLAFWMKAGPADAAQVWMGMTAEQRALREAVAGLLEKRSPESRVRELMATDTGHDETLWHDLAEMGLLGLAIPEAHGGTGAGHTELGIIMEEMGRALLCAPFLFPGARALNMAAKICIFVVLVASYDLLLGYTGVVSFAHTMFFGIGGYGVAIALSGLWIIGERIFNHFT